MPHNSRKYIVKQCMQQQQQHSELNDSRQTPRMPHKANSRAAEWQWQWESPIVLCVVKRELQLRDNVDVDDLAREQERCEIIKKMKLSEILMRQKARATGTNEQESIVGAFKLFNVFLISSWSGWMCSLTLCCCQSMRACNNVIVCWKRRREAKRAHNSISNI